MHPAITHELTRVALADRRRDLRHATAAGIAIRHRSEADGAELPPHAVPGRRAAATLLRLRDAARGALARGKAGAPDAA